MFVFLQPLFFFDADPLNAATDLLLIQKKVANDMTEHYGEARTIPEGMVKDNVALLEQMMLEKTRVDEHIRRNFTDPLNKYKQQYREMEERMRERQRRYEGTFGLKNVFRFSMTGSDLPLSFTPSSYWFTLF